MPKVPDLNIPPAPKQLARTIIICSRDKRALTDSDKAEIEKFIEFRRQRFLKSKGKRRKKL